MSLLEELLMFIINFNLLGNHGNILGFLWLVALTILFYVRFMPKNSNDGKFKKIWLNCHAILTAFLCTWFLQIIMDEFVTSPLNLLSGSWSMIEASSGPFTLMKFATFKFDVYLQLAAIIIVFTIQNTWLHFHLSKQVMFWLVLTVVFQSMLSYFHIWNHHAYQGQELIVVFYSVYPEFRILTGFLGANLIGKKVNP